jgi:hypothetical protein
MAKTYTGKILLDNADLQVKLLDEGNNGKTVNIGVKKAGKFCGGICITPATFEMLKGVKIPAPTSKPTSKSTTAKKTPSKPSELTLDADMINALKKLLG